MDISQKVKIEFVWILIKYADTSVLERLIKELRPYKNSIISKSLKNGSYDLFHDYLKVVKDQCKHPKGKVTNMDCINLSNFLYLLEEVINNSPFRGISKENIKAINTIIYLILEQKKFIYCQGNNLYCYDLQEILETQKAVPKIYYLQQSNYALFIKKQNGRFVKVEKVNKLVNDIRLSRYKTIYKALANAIEETKKSNYCPWCNPDKTLIHSPKQRRCNECQEIFEAIVEIDPTRKNTLNDTIYHIDVKNNLNAKIKKRGNALLKMLNFETNNNKFLTNIQQKIKKQFRLD